MLKRRLQELQLLQWRWVALALMREFCTLLASHNKRFTRVSIQVEEREANDRRGRRRRRGAGRCCIM